MITKSVTLPLYICMFHFVSGHVFCKNYPSTSYKNQISLLIRLKSSHFLTLSSSGICKYVVLFLLGDMSMALHHPQPTCPFLPIAHMYPTPSPTPPPILHPHTPQTAVCNSLVLHLSPTCFSPANSIVACSVSLTY